MNGSPSDGHDADPAATSLSSADGRSMTAPSESHALVSHIDWSQIEALVRAQQRNREVHTPSISLFRWWARRPHALIGGILDAATNEGTTAPVISDPFSGGGTVALEAARRGLTTYAQDLHPWAITGLRSALEEVDSDELAKAASLLLESLNSTRQELYATSCPDHDHGASEVITALWVRRVACPCCESDVFLYPYSYISRASRAADETHGWWGCSGCGGVTRSSLAARERRCRHCRRRLGDRKHALLADRRAGCRNSHCRHHFDAFDRPTTWALALVQRACDQGGRKTAHLDQPTTAEISAAQSSLAWSAPALHECIPDGLETAVLHRAGFSSWSELYAPRQIVSLVRAVEAIDQLPCGAQIKNRLRLAVCGAGEMAGRVSRWDRHYPKAYEAIANHRFAVTGLSAEVNLLADRGRGVLHHRLAASVYAARWRSDNLPANVRVRKRAATGPRVALDGVLVAHGSSARQLARDTSVDLVLTDPPYFDDVQYAELAALFLVWARVSGLAPDSVELDLDAEAVANTRRGVDAERYKELLTEIMTETHRTLKPSGRMILTFHNTDLRAWWALGGALQDAGFSIRALVVSWAENDADHSKRGRLAFTRDLVIECRPSPSPIELVEIEPEVPDDQSHELLTAGRVIASMPCGEPLSAFRSRYRKARGVVTDARISPTQQERRHD